MHKQRPLIVTKISDRDFQIARISIILLGTARAAPFAERTHSSGD
jgi:hypothetical protein